MEYKIVKLVRDSRSRSAAIAIGAGFIRTDTGAKVPGNWAGTEMDQNFRSGTLNEPCRMWIGTPGGPGEWSYFLRAPSV